MPANFCTETYMFSLTCKQEKEYFFSVSHYSVSFKLMWIMKSFIYEYHSRIEWSIFSGMDKRHMQMAFVSMSLKDSLFGIFKGC